MRIAHVVGSKTPENIQGNERHVVDLAGAQRARGLTAAVVTNCDGLFSSCASRTEYQRFW